VYVETLDELKGVLFVKDLFRMDEPSTESIMRRLREPFVVPETRLVLELLPEMRQRRIAFAVAVDEHGGVEGVLTVKDLVSELVGDLPDEFDAIEDATITRIDARRWLVHGGSPIDDVASEIGVEIPEGEYVTIGGFLFDRFGRITDEGDVLAYEGYEFQVTEMDRRRIAKIVVRAPSATIDPPTETAGTGK
jgi:CBS domain containing-hemolysin-like protein